MDAARFDALSRALATPVARRRLLRAALAAIPAALLRRAAGAAQQTDCAALIGIACQGEFGCGEGPNGFCQTHACCDGVCTDLSADDANCGACGFDCPAGTACANGQCASLCQEPLAFCGEGCVDLASDPEHCGACGQPCGPGTTCANAACVCDAGLLPCANGCVDPASDPANCGGCGVACPAGSDWAGGTCAPICPEGTAACDGACVDLLADPANCGACAAVCGAGQACCAGRCADTATDPGNCGGCGTVCPEGIPCADGTCPAEEASVQERVVLEAVDPALCVARPVPAERLARLSSPAMPAATPDAEPGAPSRQDLERIFDDQPSAPREIREPAIEAVRAHLACQNAGDPRRQWASLSDEALARAAAGLDAELLGAIDDAEPVPLPPGDRVRLRGRPSVRLLEDGRVAVRARLSDPSLPEPETDPIYLLRDIEGTWKIERILPVRPLPLLGGKGTITVRLALCPPGMDADDFVAGACEPMRLDLLKAEFYETIEPDSLSSTVPSKRRFDEAWGGYVSKPEEELDLPKAWYLAGGYAKVISPTGNWTMPGALPIPTSGGRTYFAVPLTRERPEVVLTAYSFREPGCAAGTGECYIDQLRCGERWIHPVFDAANCGGCGKACSGATPDCFYGICRAG